MSCIFPQCCCYIHNPPYPFTPPLPALSESQFRPHAVFVAPLLPCPTQSLLLGLMVLAYCDDQCTVPYLTSLYSRNIPPAPLALSLAVLTDGGDLYTDPCLTLPLRLLRCPALAGSRLRLTGSVGTSAAAGLRPCGQLPAALRLPPPPTRVEGSQLSV